ncbi:MAG TPA: glycosyltransferase, partial [Nitrospina sp.]|nr:glycosyltransferase [Nitrospina sp.]
LLVDIAKELSQIQFVLIGNGPEEQYVEKSSKQNKNIQFLGKIKNSELHEFYNSADIFCFPSLYDEGFGRVGMEAVSCGLPVVGSNLGGISEALDDTVSVLVNPTHENLKTAILELYENPDAIKILKKACRDYALKRFSINNIKSITKHYAR